MKVGIARGLLFYRYYPFWKTFFEELGMEVVVSTETTKSIVELGLKRAVDEICLPVKIYHGHIEELIGKVDYIFLPRIVSVEHKRFKRYTCPKFIGLPDMIKGAFEELPNVLEVEIDLMNEPMVVSYQRLGYKLGRPQVIVSKAINKALTEQRAYDQLILKGNSPMEAMEVIFNNSDTERHSYSKTQELTIVVVSHPYILFDRYLSADIINKLRILGAEVITSFSFPHKLIEAEMSKYKEVAWSYEREIIACISYYLAKPNTYSASRVDGIIYLISFGCGPGSIVREILLREVEGNSTVPFLSLIMDEHSGESGILTRIDAFIDMIKMKRKR